MRKKGYQRSFKAVVMQYYDDRNDVWSMDVSMHCDGVHDLTAAEAQYHIRFYDEFRKRPVHADQISMKLLVDEMFTT